jgi:hypothetical protein
VEDYRLQAYLEATEETSVDNFRGSMTFPRDFDIVLSPDHRVEENGEMVLTSVNSNPIITIRAAEEDNINSISVKSDERLPCRLSGQAIHDRKRKESRKPCPGRQRSRQFLRGDIRASP